MAELRAERLAELRAELLAELRAELLAELRAELLAELLAEPLAELRKSFGRALCGALAELRAGLRGSFVESLWQSFELSGRAFWQSLW